jgi:hypothetical protein
MILRSMARVVIGAARGRCRHAAAAVVFALVALAGAHGSALAEKRVALVIGNDLYEHVSALRKAVTDANAVASSLRELGFTVVVGANQTRGTMSQALLAFDSAIEPGDTAFFFFAGHGFEIRGQNYLLPTDVPAATEGQEELVRDASFALDRIIDRAQARGARTAIVVLDACRNNPFARAGTRAVGGSGGLAPVTPPEGVFVLFSAGAKQTALDRLSDNDPDPNSVFTRQFVRELATPGQTLVQIAKRTQSEVKQSAGSVRHEQTPAYYDEIVGDVVLNGKTGEPAPEARTAGLGVPAPQTLAPPPAAQAPGPAPGQPVNAPIAGFMRHNGGWSVSLSFIEPVTAIAWRLGESGPFKETGLLDSFDPRTRRRQANPSFELDADTAAGVIQVRGVDLDGQIAGPFPIAFDPVAETARGDRRILEMTAGSWVSFREYNGLLLYYTQVVSFRCAVRELRIGIDSAVPDRAIPLPPCDLKNPAAIPDRVQPYLKLPPATKMVSIELTYRDGSVSEIKTFRK